MSKKTNQQAFLLSFFSSEGYQEKQVNGFWLVKQYNGDTENWQIAIYTKESFKNYKQFNKEQSKLLN